MNTDPLHEAARLLGARGGKAPKRITDQDRQRRRDWAKGLAAIRASKRASALTKFVVIDRDGGLHEIDESTGGLAIERARHYGIDAVGVRQQQTKGNEQ